MLSSFRTRFGIPGVISVIALVFAMLGGAYAASNDSGKATASAKAKRGPRGPKGPKGDTGPAGPQGPAGANGKDGSNGSNGANGTSATTSTFSGSEHGCTAGAGGVLVKSASPEVAVCNGKNGKSVTSEALDPGNENCPEGGSEFESTSGVTYACNGSPWTAGGTLPKGATETGMWSYGMIPVTGENPSGEKSGTVYVPLSLSIPLSTSVSSENFHFLEAGETTTDCPGSAEDPEAKEGHLCVYAFESGAPFFVGVPFKTGAVMIFSGEDAGLKTGYGSFAVTGF